MLLGQGLRQNHSPHFEPRARIAFVIRAAAVAVDRGEGGRC